GYFNTAGGVSAHSVARWNPTNSVWSALGSGVSTVNGFYSTSVNAIEAHPNGEIYVGGSFNRAGGMVANGIAKWSNNSWTTMGSGITGGGYASVAALAAAGADVYAGGEFTTAGGKLSYFFAHWNALGQTGYVPTLEFTSSSNNLVLSWPSAAEGFVIETTGQLSPTTTWTPVTSTPQVAGD